MSSTAKIMIILGGILAVITAWLPLKEGVTFLEGPNNGAAGKIVIVIGALGILMGLLGRKWAAIIALLVGLAGCGMGAIWMTHKEETGELGYGVWVMIAGSAIMLIGAIMGMMKKKV